MRKKNCRLSVEEKEKILQGTGEGKSLREISRAIGINLTTIYYHVRKTKPKIKKEFVVNLTDEEIGELVGAFAGDGSYYLSSHGRSRQHKVRYSLSLVKDLRYATRLLKFLKRMNLNPFLIKSEKDNKLEVLVNSKDFIKFVQSFLDWDGKKTYSVKLKKNLSDYNENFLRGFVRGLMDTDGFVEISNVSCGCVSEELMRNFGDILDKFDIGYKLTRKSRNLPRRDLFLIRIYRNSLEKYNDLFGFSNEYKKLALEKILKFRK